VAVLEKQRVLVANDTAAGLGIKPGMGTATARALAKDVLLLERDRGAEERCLGQLCCWAYGVTPTLYPYRENCLLLEIGSCLKLYGDVEAVLSRVRADLARRGYSYRYGLGPTPGSAFLFTNPLEACAHDSGEEAPHHRHGSDTHPLKTDAHDSGEEAPHHRHGSDTHPLKTDARDSGEEAPHHRHGSDTHPLEAYARDSGEEAPHHRHGSDTHPLESRARDSGEEALTLEEKLATLPLKLLEDFPREVDALAKAGLWTFGDILALPRRALARRCGKEFAHHLEQVLGIAEDRCPVFEPPREFSDDYWFGYEVKANQELLPAIELLLQSLCRFLRNTQLETRQVEWLLYGIDRSIHRFEVFSSLPQTSWRAWYELTRLKVEQLELAEGLEGVGLASHSLVSGSSTSGDLFRDSGQKEPLHSLLDRLKSRLGLQSVSKIAIRDEHLPEFAGYCSLDTRPATVHAENGELRPFWLMQEPERLNEFNGEPCRNGRLKLLDGPERIEDNWWDRAVSRDYYVARDGSGMLFWVYRDRLDNHWYLQGVFH
jgi:hypothetical protein